jgi:hypothetical protein
VSERSLKDEMRKAVRADRERAEARRKAEAEGTVPELPPRPAIDLNKPIAELKRPSPPVQPAPVAEPSREPEPAPEPAPRRSLFARLFRR